ncbi:hypothetical protein SIDU_03655 [Sphingobium indicum B90A]|uniref:Uncharacterized protein n=1 Tax=Sphingobium indicum (strain DSM 16412 / CCM 7286 / MTCC 6364 / B90A) TaxID=861109 RepID=A0A1L5BLE1_SPHIB|nr:hypothetical protein SIDU_03655 [Sphingobium indicum B90A]
MLHELRCIKVAIGARISTQRIPNGQPRLHCLTPNISIIGLGKHRLLPIAEWLVSFGLHPDEMSFGHNGGIKPGVTTALPGKAHLPFNFHRGRWPFDVIKAGESRKQVWSLDEPAKSISRQGGTAFGTCEFTGGQFVTTRPIQ